MSQRMYSFARIAALVMVVGAILVANGCRRAVLPGGISPEAIGDSESSVASSASDYAKEKSYCPTGYEFDASSRFCVRSGRALGPFPEAMRLTCVDPKKYDGQRSCTEAYCNIDSVKGTQLCADPLMQNRVLWMTNVAVAIRRDLESAAGERSTCAPGSSYDASLEMCASRRSAQGPFTEAQHTACVAVAAPGSSEAAECEGMQWSLALAKKVSDRLPKKTPVPVKLVEKIEAQTKDAVSGGMVRSSSIDRNACYFPMREVPRLFTSAGSCASSPEVRGCHGFRGRYLDYRYWGANTRGFTHGGGTHAWGGARDYILDEGDPVYTMARCMVHRRINMGGASCGRGVNMTCKIGKHSYDVNYCHLQSWTSVPEGIWLPPGTQVGRGGHSGNAKKVDNHLHLTLHGPAADTVFRQNGCYRALPFDTADASTIAEDDGIPNSSIDANAAEGQPTEGEGSEVLSPEQVGDAVFDGVDFG